MNQHTKSKMDGGDGLEQPTAYADNCDCTIQYDEPAAGLRQGILFCPLHEAAGDLLTACEAIVRRIELGATSRGHPAPQDETFIAARAAIAKARGQ